MKDENVIEICGSESCIGKTVVDINGINKVFKRENDLSKELNIMLKSFEHIKSSLFIDTSNGQPIETINSQPAEKKIDKHRNVDVSLPCSFELEKLTEDSPSSWEDICDEIEDEIYEPVVEQVIEPVVEQVIEPVVEQVIEPVVEPINVICRHGVVCEITGCCKNHNRKQCLHGMDCGKFGCYYDHPVELVIERIRKQQFLKEHRDQLHLTESDCIFYDTCINMYGRGCCRNHPNMQLCKYGDNCTNPKCRNNHSLKWINQMLVNIRTRDSSKPHNRNASVYKPPYKRKEGSYNSLLLPL